MFKQIIRGCGTLPHVGDHPGTEMLVGLTIVSGLACLSAGLTQAIIGTCLAAVIYGGIFAVGAYNRACLSDKMEAR